MQPLWTLAPGGCAASQAAPKSPPASHAAPVLLGGPSAIAYCAPEPAPRSHDRPEMSETVSTRLSRHERFFQKIEQLRTPLFILSVLIQFPNAAEYQSCFLFHLTWILSNLRWSWHWRWFGTEWLSLSPDEFFPQPLQSDANCPVQTRTCGKYLKQKVRKGYQASGYVFSNVSECWSPYL